MRPKFDIKIENLRIAQYPDCSTISSIFLGDEVTKTYAFSMSERYWKINKKETLSNTEQEADRE